MAIGLQALWIFLTGSHFLWYKQVRWGSGPDQVTSDYKMLTYLLNSQTPTSASSRNIVDVIQRGFYSIFANIKRSQHSVIMLLLNKWNNKGTNRYVYLYSIVFSYNYSVCRIKGPHIDAGKVNEQCFLHDSFTWELKPMCHCIGKNLSVWTLVPYFRTWENVA